MISADGLAETEWEPEAELIVQPKGETRWLWMLAVTLSLPWALWSVWWASASLWLAIPAAAIFARALRFLEPTTRQNAVTASRRTAGYAVVLTLFTVFCARLLGGLVGAHYISNHEIESNPQLLHGALAFWLDEPEVLTPPPAAPQVQAPPGVDLGSLPAALSHLDPMQVARSRAAFNRELEIDRRLKSMTPQEKRAVVASYLQLDGSAAARRTAHHLQWKWIDALWLSLALWLAFRLAKPASD